MSWKLTLLWSWSQLSPLNLDLVLNAFKKQQSVSTCLGLSDSKRESKLSPVKYCYSMTNIAVCLICPLPSVLRYIFKWQCNVRHQRILSKDHKDRKLSYLSSRNRAPMTSFVSPVWAWCHRSNAAAMGTLVLECSTSAVFLPVALSKYIFNLPLRPATFLPYRCCSYLIECCKLALKAWIFRAWLLFWCNLFGIINCEDSELLNAEELGGVHTGGGRWGLHGSWQTYHHPSNLFVDFQKHFWRFYRPVHSTGDWHI